jgi:hypothetical protein
LILFNIHATILKGSAENTPPITITSPGHPVLTIKKPRFIGSGECAGSAIFAFDLNNANYDTKNGIIGPKTNHFCE